MILPFEILFIVIWTVECVNITYNQVNNKTKRTLSQHLFNYGDTKPVLVYRETFVPPAFISDDYSNLKSEYKPAIPIDLPEPVKLYRPQYPSQQRLYEFSKLVPNGHINQLPVFNRDEQLVNYKEQPLTTGVDSQNFVPAESVVLPVEHRQPDVIVPHQNSYSNANVRYNLVPFRKQTHVGEKVNYDLSVPPQHSAFVNQFAYQPQVNTVPLFSNPYNTHFQKLQSVPVVNYINRNYNPRKQNLNSPKYISSQYGRNILLHRKPSQSSYSPVKVPLKRDEVITPKNEGEEQETKKIQKIEDNNGKSKKTSINEDEENERDSAFPKNSYDFEENDHFDYKEDKDLTEEVYDRDNKRDSTTHISFKKYPGKHKNEKSNIKNYHKFQGSDYNQEHLKQRPGKNDNKKSKMIYKSVDFSKETDDSDDDSLEGKHSENIPVTRKHRLLREKWYLSKNIDDIEKK